MCTGNWKSRVKRFLSLSLVRHEEQLKKRRIESTRKMLLGWCVSVSASYSINGVWVTTIDICQVLREWTRAKLEWDNLFALNYFFLQFPSRLSLCLTVCSFIQFAWHHSAGSSYLFSPSSSPSSSFVSFLPHSLFITIQDALFSLLRVKIKGLRDERSIRKMTLQKDGSSSYIEHRVRSASPAG